jgi:hypothetical protein
MDCDQTAMGLPPVTSAVFSKLFGKIWVSRSNIWDVLATPSGIKREWHVIIIISPLQFTAGHRPLHLPAIPFDLRLLATNSCQPLAPGLRASYTIGMYVCKIFCHHCCTDLGNAVCVGDHRDDVVERQQAVALDLRIHVLPHRTASEQLHQLNMVSVPNNIALVTSYTVIFNVLEKFKIRFYKNMYIRK